MGTPVLQWMQDRLNTPVGGVDADEWHREPIWHDPPRVTDPDGVNGPESDGNATDQDVVSSMLNAGANVASIEKSAVKQGASAVKRSSTAKRLFLKAQALDDKTPSWMTPWLERGVNPPGYQVDQ